MTIFEVHFTISIENKNSLKEISEALFWWLLLAIEVKETWDYLAELVDD